MRRGSVITLSSRHVSLMDECATRLGSNKEAAARIGVHRDTLGRILLRQNTCVMSTTMESAERLVRELRAEGINVGRRGQNQLTRKRWHCKMCDRDLPVAAFNRRTNKHGERTHRYTCKACESRGRWQHDGPTGYVLITQRIWDIYDEIVRRCGSQAEAARRLEMTARALNRILWRAHDRVQARTAQKAMILLRDLRAENVWLEKTHSAKRAQYADDVHCRTCGTTLDNYTEDCGTCWERRNGRARRLDPEMVKLMKAADRRSKKKARERRAA